MMASAEMATVNLRLAYVLLTIPSQRPTPFSRTRSVLEIALEKQRFVVRTVFILNSKFSTSEFKIKPNVENLFVRIKR